MSIDTTTEDVKDYLMTKPEMLAAALKYHATDPGAWLETDPDLTEISDVIRDPQREKPYTRGRNWWRTHNLVRQLGGVALDQAGAA